MMMKFFSLIILTAAIITHCMGNFYMFTKLITEKKSIGMKNKKPKIMIFFLKKN